MIKITVTDSDIHHIGPLAEWFDTIGVLCIPFRPRNNEYYGFDATIDDEDYDDIRKTLDLNGFSYISVPSSDRFGFISDFEDTNLEVDTAESIARDIAAYDENLLRRLILWSQRENSKQSNDGKEDGK